MTLTDEIFSAPKAPPSGELTVTGQIPAYVRGTYYLNGPASYVAGDLTRQHWLDGDGMVRRLHFEDDRVTFQARHVTTVKRRDEGQADAPLYRSFGTAFSGDTLRKGVTLETPANVSVYPFADRLLAFGEQSPPWRMNPETLETLAEEDFDGKLGAVTPFSAHPKIDLTHQRLCNFGIRYMKGRGILSWYEFDHALELITRGSAMLPAGNYIHDFALSPHYALFFLAPYTLDIKRFINDGVSLQDALIWNGDAHSQLLILDRATGRETARINLGHEGFSLHTIQAEELESGDLRLDLLTCERPFYDQYIAPMFLNIPPIRVAQFVVNPAEGKLVSKDINTLDDHLDFASFDRRLAPDRVTHWWALGMPVEPAGEPKLYNRLVRYDHRRGRLEETRHAPANCFYGGEPVHLQDPDHPHRACVIIQERNQAAETSAYLILNAFDLNAAPLARLDVNGFDPLGFHTWFRHT